MYIRFGDIPEDECSIKWDRENHRCKTEKGVSVYNCTIYPDGSVGVVIDLPITAYTLHTFQSLVEYDDRPCYLVEGDCVGRGSDNEPLIKNVRIVKQIEYRKK